MFDRYSRLKNKVSSSAAAMKSRSLVVGSVATAAVATASNAFATGVVDYSGLSASVTSELTNALTVAVPLAGTLLAVGIGWKFIRRFTK